MQISNDFTEDYKICSFCSLQHHIQRGDFGYIYYFQPQT